MKLSSKQIAGIVKILKERISEQSLKAKLITDNELVVKYEIPILLKQGDSEILVSYFYGSSCREYGLGCRPIQDVVVAFNNIEKFTLSKQDGEAIRGIIDEELLKRSENEDKERIDLIDSILNDF